MKFCHYQSLNDACSGGWPQYAYEYMVAAPGISAAKDYPYTGVVSFRWFGFRFASTVKRYFFLEY